MSPRPNGWPPAEPDAVRRDNLLAMAQVNRNILSRPPETLREACQWIVWYHLASRHV